MAILYPNVIQVCNSEGPIAGAKMYFYAAGSTVPKKVFNDHNLESVATQPLVTNAMGIFPEYFAQLGAYRIQIFDANDNLLATRDWLTLAGGSGSDSFPVPENSGYLHYDIDTDTFTWIDGELDTYKVKVDSGDTPDYLGTKFENSDTVEWTVEDHKVKANVIGEFDTYKVKADADDTNPGFLKDKLADTPNVTWTVDGDKKLVAEITAPPAILESVSAQNCSTFRDLGVDIGNPQAIGAYFFAKDEINIARVCTIIPNLESLTAGDIQFAIYKPAYIEIAGGIVPLVGSSGVVSMDKIATGEIQFARQLDVYAVGALETPVTVKGWFCVVLSNTPSASWPSIYASFNMSEMMSMAEPEDQIPLQFIRDDIVNAYATTETMWPSTINSLYGINPSILNKNLIPYIRLELE